MHQEESYLTSIRLNTVKTGSLIATEAEDAPKSDPLATGDTLIH